MTVALDLPPEPGAAGSARRWARTLLGPSVHEDTAESVALVLTELVQNAVLHASTPMRVELLVAGDGVRVKVADGSPVLPSSGLTSAQAMSGRGLLMVAAVASAWGAEPRPGGKVVWAHVQHGRGADEEVTVDELLGRWSDDGDQHVRTAGPPLVVPDLPTTTMLAVKTHNDDVFRELTLCAIGQDSRTAEDVAELAGRARRVLATFAQGRQQVRNQVLSALRSGAETFDLVLGVDDGALGVLGDYLDILERADEWAASGRLLSEPPDADVLAVRRHYLTRLITAAQAG